jgi:hypothetical protein
MENTLVETPKWDNHNLYIKKNTSSFTNSIKIPNNENGILNQFTLTAFNSFKNHKNTLIKNDQLLMPNNSSIVNSNLSIRKENINNFSKNSLVSDIRSTASPIKIHGLSVPSAKIKNFSITNPLKFLNK